MDGLVHFRRCHHCGTVHTLDDQLYFEYECDCGAELTPFYYSQHDGQPATENLLGLSVVWSEAWGFQ